MKSNKEHSEAIKLQGEIYPILIDIIPEGVVILNKEGIVLYCNPYFTKMVNLPSEKIVGTNFKNFIVDATVEPFDALLTNGLTQDITEEIFLKANVDIVMPMQISVKAFELENDILLSVFLTDNTTDNNNKEEIKVKTGQLETTINQLKESEEKIRLILNSTKIGAWEWDLKIGANVPWRSLTHDQIYGYEHLLSEWSYETFLSHVIPEDREYVNQQIQERYVTDKLDIQCRIQRADDNSIRWIAIQGFPYFNEKGEVTKMMGTIRDIHEQKQAEEKLKDSDTQIRTIFRRAPDAVTVIDQQGIITKWNPRAEAIFGWTAQEALGHPLHEIIIPERYREAHLNGMKHFLETGEGPILNKPIEVPALRKNDSEIQIELSISNFQFKNKDYFIGFLKDITKRKTAEDKLRESEERFLKIFDNNPVAMTLSEIKTNKIAYANNLFYTTFGYTAEEVIGNTSEELNLIAPEENQRVVALVLDSLHEKRTISELQSLTVEETEELLIKLKQTNAMKDFEIKYTRKNGETFYALVFYETIRIGQQRYTITSYQDITERKMAEDKVKQKSKELALLNEELALKNKESEKRAAQLSAANQELIFQIEEKEKKDAELTTANTDLKEKEDLIAHKESILAILSHDLRSPLAGIIGTAEYLQSHVEEMDPAEVKELLKLLYESSKKELNMLDYLVEWARVKYASEAFCPEKIELAHYVNKVFDLLNESAAKNEVKLHNEVEEDFNVCADGKMVLSILQNIISNAIKHSLPCDTITVSAKKEPDKIIVQIKDTGIGMSKQTLEKLFTPQMETLSSERKENKGAGIGLLLVKGFLEKNGGDIWVESEEGKGSSFYFTLPVHPTADSI